MPSERARPLLAFAVITVVCALVIAANMLRHPTATATAVEAARLVQGGPQVEFGTELASRPVEEAPPTGNVLTVALRAPVVAVPVAARRADAGPSSRTRTARVGHLGRPAKTRHTATPPHRTPTTPPHRLSPAQPPAASPFPTRGHDPQPGKAPGHATHGAQQAPAHVRGHQPGPRANQRSARQHGQSGRGHGQAARGTAQSRYTVSAPSIRQGGHRYGHGHADTVRGQGASQNGPSGHGHGGGQGAGHDSGPGPASGHDAGHGPGHGPGNGAGNGGGHGHH